MPISVKRGPILALSLCLSACAASKPPPQPQAETPPAPAPETPADSAEAKPIDEDTLGAAVLACDGEAAASAFAGWDDAALGAFEGSEADAGLRLLAAWKRRRVFASGGQMDADRVREFGDVAATILGVGAPPWWVDQLAAGVRVESGAVGYDVGITKTGDRRGSKVEGPGGSLVREGVARVLTKSGGDLAIDLSARRLELGPLPAQPHQTIEIGRQRAGATVFVATFDAASGGFRFPLHAYGNEGLLWKTEVCGPDRRILGGLGHLTTEIVASRTTPDRVHVFTAESHGVALDVFDTADGRRVIAWSSDAWFHRPEPPK